jgi:hypothetical protein
VRRRCRVRGVKLNYAGRIGMAKAVDALIIISRDEESGAIPRQSTNELLIACIKVLVFVNN